MLEVEKVEVPEYEPSRAGKLEDRKPATRTQDPVNLCQGGIYAHHVPDSESDRHPLKLSVREGEMLGIAAAETGWRRSGAGLSNGPPEHRERDVYAHDRGAEIAARDLKREIAGSRCQIKHPPRRPGSKPVNRAATPHDVDACAQNMVEQVIRSSDPIEQSADEGPPHFTVRIHGDILSLRRTACFILSTGGSTPVQI